MNVAVYLSGFRVITAARTESLDVYYAASFKHSVSNTIYKLYNICLTSIDNSSVTS